MLLILSLVYLLARYRAVSGHPLGSRDEPVSCDSNVNSRSLFTIITSCLITVFACTWFSVHPNVPPPNQSKLALFWRRLGLMLVAVIAPELMVGFAARQFWDARWFAKEYNVSITHGFFFAMGGFVSQDGHHPIATPNQLRLQPEYVAAIQRIEAEDIEDKSKGDSMSKGVSLLQGLWFIVQCLARVHQHLPLTQLEVATLAFQFVSVFIWVLWWHKPLDVQQPIPIGPKLLDVQEPILMEPLPLVPRFMIGVVTPVLFGIFQTFDPSSSTSVPAFWSSYGLEIKFIGQSARSILPAFLEGLIGTIFGIIHCAAWHAYFPSTDEMLLWRASSLVVILWPSVAMFINQPLLNGLEVLYPISRHPIVNGVLSTIRVVGNRIQVLVYAVARIILCALAFTTLRALPPNAFVDVNWTTYIPHF
ncbi:hypothetical protein C8R45DRAFT_1018477 [Mycena sanguinolenta]|nr:hypothetical protein C8R45DRAFT_1018477 [Mycena sanguinolenta]